MGIIALCLLFCFFGTNVAFCFYFYSIEVLNTDNPKRWKTLSRLTLPNPTYDHCSIALNKTSLFVTGGFGQEAQSMILDLKSKQFYPTEPMIHPRRQVYKLIISNSVANYKFSCPIFLQ